MNEYILNINNREYRVQVNEIDSEKARIQVNGQEFSVGLQQLGLAKLVPAASGCVQAAPEPAVGTGTAAAVPVPAVSPTGDSSLVKSPLPGLINSIKVSEGDKVRAGQDILVMETMKMENQIQATIDGTVKKIFVKKGDNVAENDPLIEIVRA